MDINEVWIHYSIKNNKTKVIEEYTFFSHNYKETNFWNNVVKINYNTHSVTRIFFIFSRNENKKAINKMYIEVKGNNITKKNIRKRKLNPSISGWENKEFNVKDMIEKTIY